MFGVEAGRQEKTSGQAGRKQGRQWKKANCCLYGMPIYSFLALCSVWGEGKFSLWHAHTQALSILPCLVPEPEKEKLGGMFCAFPSVGRQAGRAGAGHLLAGQASEKAGTYLGRQRLICLCLLSSPIPCHACKRTEEQEKSVSLSHMALSILSMLPAYPVSS